MKCKYLFFVIFLFITNNALADINNQNILDKVLNKYKTVAATWKDVLMDNALWLFWCLVLISMIFTFSLMILKQADLSEFFAEFFRFIMFTGFYLWLLRNAPEIGGAIIKGLGTLAARAAGVSDTPSPSSIVDIGFAIFDKVLSQSSIWSPIDSALGIVIALIILVIIALVAINMLLLLITSWILLYAGIFLLGFGGSKWTSDIAINYYKTVLGISVQIFTMVLIIGIGKTFVDEYFNSMSESLNFSELAVMLIVSIVLLYLTNKLPPLMSGIISGASVSGMGVGSFSAGAMVGAASTVASGMSVAKGSIASGATSIGGGAKALMEAFKGTSESNSGSDQSSGDTSSSESPLSSAMGDSDSDSDGSLSAGDSDNSGTESSGSSSSAGGQSSGTESSGSSSSAGGQSSGTDNPKIVETSKNGFMKNLAAGTASLAKQAFRDKIDNFNANVDKTAGGKLASQIKANKKNKGDRK